ncbi:MAG: hypothetical protein ABIC19_03265 [Patescibacteria group bacterium]
MTVNLTPERKGEIALILVRHRFTHEETTLNPEKIRRSVGNLSKMTGIPREELQALIRELLEEVIEESFKERSKRKE